MRNTSLAYAPATVANLGVGFDVLGLALSRPGDRVRATLATEPGVRITSITGDGGLLTHDQNNTAGIAAAAVLARLGRATGGLELELEKGLPLASGLGSSAASAVAAAVATNALFGSRLSQKSLLAACLEAEAAVSGRHADNVAPALLGGILLLRGDDWQTLPLPPDIEISLVIPELRIPTAEARDRLPTQIPLQDLVKQTAAIAQLVDALHRQDWRAAVAAMEADCVIEPARHRLIPGLSEARAKAKAAGALGLIISGAGPSLCLFSNDSRSAQAAAAAARAVLATNDIDSQSQFAEISAQGARLLATDSP